MRFIPTMWSDFLQDIRYGIRRLRSNPGFTAVVVLVLALGIGANTAIFSLVNGVLLQPLPYEGGDRLVVLRQGAPRAGIESVPFSVDEIADYRRDSRSFEGVVEYHNMQFNLIGRGEPQRTETGVVSWQFFDVFGIHPVAGRAFRAEDEALGAPPVVLLSYEFWRRSFGGDKSIVGQTFEMNGKVHTVIGVLPPIPQYPNENDVYMPTSACPFRSAPMMTSNRAMRMMQVFAKLKPGVSIEQARANIAAIGGNFELQYPAAYPKGNGYSIAALNLKDVLTQRARTTLFILLGTSSLVLLIACANVANLALARLLRREREMAV
ncbi:MAG: ABC transporter permease, partial [Bryobacteraceae bacterium]